MYKIIRFVFPALLLSACINNTNNGSTTTDTKTSTLPTQPNRPAIVPASTSYRLVTAKDSIKHIRKYLPDNVLPILLAVNRTDSAHISNLDTLIVPLKLEGNANQYSPFPASAPFLKDVNKVIFFSYPAQYFAAYEHGQLVYTGPTNMGRQKDTTPTGLFHTNWKAEETHSTFNDEWDLKWNFNIENKEGIGFHEYAMPGYPASHSCLRLSSNDAQDLYNWADEWILKGKSDIVAQGTPVIVFGAYPFGSSKPWLQLANNSHALDITVSQLQNETQPYLNEIMNEQQKRMNTKAK
ncbi:MAG: L,D-transpeptidase [Flavipsychrobacter sp.]